MGIPSGQPSLSCLGLHFPPGYSEWSCHVGGHRQRCPRVHDRGRQDGLIGKFRNLRTLRLVTQTLGGLITTSYCSYNLSPRMPCAGHSGACVARGPQACEMPQGREGSPSNRFGKSLVWQFTLSNNTLKPPEKSCEKEAYLTLFKPGVSHFFWKGPVSKYLRLCRLFLSVSATPLSHCRVEEAVASS